MIDRTGGQAARGTRRSLIDIFPDATNNYHRFEENEGGMDYRDFIPGDRVRMNNHTWIPSDGDGLEGSNVIYLGTARKAPLFLHMDGGFIEDYLQMQITVQDYSADPSRQEDPSNYKITERYTPLVPDFLR